MVKKISPNDGELYDPSMEDSMSCSDIAPRQKSASVARVILEMCCNVVSWFNEHFWVGSQRELAEKERYDALREKDKQIVALRELLYTEQQLTTELSEEILSLDNKLVAVELQLCDDEIVIDSLRGDLSVLAAQRNSILGGRRRKRR